jgi:hypothetical protein
LCNSADNFHRNWVTVNCFIHVNWICFLGLLRDRSLAKSSRSPGRGRCSVQDTVTGCCLACPSCRKRDAGFNAFLIASSSRQTKIGYNRDLHSYLIKWLIRKADCREVNQLGGRKVNDTIASSCREMRCTLNSLKDAFRILLLKKLH